MKEVWKDIIIYFLFVVATVWVVVWAYDVARHVPPWVLWFFHLT